MCVKEPAGFCWLFVHPHPESFPSVTAKVIYIVLGPRGTRQDQGTVQAAAKGSPCLQKSVYTHKEQQIQPGKGLMKHLAAASPE